MTQAISHFKMFHRSRVSFLFIFIHFKFKFQKQHGLNSVRLELISNVVWVKSALFQLKKHCKFYLGEFFQGWRFRSWEILPSREVDGPDVK